MSAVAVPALSGLDLPRPATLDAVTLDAHGTLVELEDPVERLRAALRAHGVERPASQVERAFRAEVEYYVPRSHHGRDGASLGRLRTACAGVFLEALGEPLDAGRFAPAFVGALQFRVLGGVREALARLRALGLSLAVVSNWDVGLHDHLEAAGIAGAVDAVVTSAEAGAAKPAATPFEIALGRLGVRPGRTLHVGDGAADAEGAAAAGMRFAPAPLAAAVEALR